MPLVSVENKKGSGSYSWASQWKEFLGGKWVTRRVTLGSDGRLSEDAAKQIDRQIQALVAAKETDMPLTRKLATWAEGISDTLHARLVKKELLRPRSLKRAQSQYTIGSVIEVFMGQVPGSKSTKSVLRAAYNNLSTFLGPKTDVRDVTARKAKEFRLWLRNNGRSIGSGILAESTCGKRVEKVSQLWNWMVDEEYVPRNVFSKASGSTAPDATKQVYVTEDMFKKLRDAQPTDQDRAICDLAYRMAMRAPSDMVMLRKSDIHWGTDSKTDPPKVSIDSLKTGKRECPIFPEARWAFEYLSSQQDDPDGFLIKGKRWDEVRAGTHETKDLSLSTRFRKRYEKATGEKCWPKIFNNLRASAITVMVKIKKIDQHSVGQWCGNTPAIQNQHYLQIMLEDHARVTEHKSEPLSEPKTLNPNQTQVVQDSLIGQVIATTSIEEMAKNTLILQHLGSLIESNKKASSLLKALLAESLQVAGAGIPKPTSNIAKYRVGRWTAVVSEPQSKPKVHDYESSLASYLDERGLSGLFADWLALIKEANQDGDTKQGFLIS
jgi:hypothetical protein